MRMLIRLGFALLALVIPGSGSSMKTGESTGFSDRTAIEKRFETTRAELRELPGTAEPALRERLQQLETACQYHLAAADLLTATRDRLAKAGEESAPWRGFSQPPPYPLPLLDEIRESIATLENSENNAQAQLRIFKTEEEALREKLASHQQAIAVIAARVRVPFQVTTSMKLSSFILHWTEQDARPTPHGSSRNRQTR